VKAAALGLDGVARALAGKTPRRVIVVPGRIVNIVS
jgi:leucyl-tRNA synthetase